MMCVRRGWATQAKPCPPLSPQEISSRDPAAMEEICARSTTYLLLIPNWHHTVLWSTKWEHYTVLMHVQSIVTFFIYIVILTCCSFLVSMQLLYFFQENKMIMVLDYMHWSSVYVFKTHFLSRKSATCRSPLFAYSDCNSNFLGHYWLEINLKRHWHKTLCLWFFFHQKRPPSPWLMH
jgi:hypothetical protein